MAEIMNGTIKIEDKASPALTALENALVKLIEVNKKLSDVLKNNDAEMKKFAESTRAAADAARSAKLPRSSPTSRSTSSMMTTTNSAVQYSIGNYNPKQPSSIAISGGTTSYKQKPAYDGYTAEDLKVAEKLKNIEKSRVRLRVSMSESNLLYASEMENMDNKKVRQNIDTLFHGKLRDAQLDHATRMQEANDREMAARKEILLKNLMADQRAQSLLTLSAARTEAAHDEEARARIKEATAGIHRHVLDTNADAEIARQAKRAAQTAKIAEDKNNAKLLHAKEMSSEKFKREFMIQNAKNDGNSQRLADREISTMKLRANAVETERQKSAIRIEEFRQKAQASNLQKMEVMREKERIQKAQMQAKQEYIEKKGGSGRRKSDILSQFMPKGDGMVSRGIGWAIGKLPAFHALGMVADVIMGIAQTVGQILKVISNSGDKERRLQQKMILSPEMFGIAKEDDKGRQKFTRELYEQAKVDSMNGLNGMEILESGVHWAHLLGASEKDPNAKFKSFDEAKKFAKSLNAISLMNGVDKQQMEVFRYQMTQVAAKGYAGRLDIRPMQESSPGMLREIVKVLHLTQEDLQNAGMTKSITWEDMKWAILQLEDKYSKLAKQERMQTIEGQKELGRNYQEASMSDFNAATGEVINTEGTFVMYKMFGDIIADIGKSMFGTTEKLDMFSEAMENVFIWIDIFVRSLYILGKVFVDSIQVLWNIAWIIIDIVLLLGVLVVGGVASGFTKILDLVAHGWELLGRAVLWGFSALMGYIMDWMYEETGWKIFKTTWSKDAAEAKKEFMTSAFGSEEDRVSGRIAKGTRELTKTGLEGINGWIEEDKGDMSRASLDAGRTIKTQFDQTVEDIKKITERENEFGKDPEAKIKEDLQKIEKNTGRSARASEKTNENIEILREIAGYQVINRVTRVQPNHYYNFGDIRSEEISTDQIVPSIANALKRGEPIFNNLGPSQVDTISAPMGMLAG